jgi:drug/metabolite transporter (DMT)-like permease
MRAWLALAAQGLLATTASTLLWNWALQRVPAARAGIFINFEPVVGTILGVGLLGESLGPAAILGGVLIVAAALVFSLHTPSGQTTP